MKTRALAFLFLALAVVLLGCLQSTPSANENQTTLNQTPSSNVSAAIPTVEGPRIASAALCRVVSPGQAELFLVDPTRYAYELQVVNGSGLEIIYANDTLYLHYVAQVVPGCDWLYFTQDDLASVDQIGGVQLLTHAELASRLSADTCQTVPLLEQVFTLPVDACPFREALLRAQAG